MLPLVYDELRKLAAHRMARERADHTLQPTALVHEAWLRLAGADHQSWHNRRHFVAVASEAMRRILSDRARRRRRVRHGGGLDRLDVDEVEIAALQNDDHLLKVHEALDRFAAEDPEKAELVKLRFFVGMSDCEVTELLGLSERTVERYWAYAKARLFIALREQD